jgi:RHS repeat-associated protein
VIADAVRVVGIVNRNHATDVFYAHTDHLGTVVKLTDESGQLAWDAERLPFGETRVLTERVEMPLRLPGQYYDEESGLYYNYFRDYDPSTGRYIQSDPIGLEGGSNTYAYAGGNPLRHIDPLGLDYNCGPGYTDISGTTSSGPVNCVPNYKPTESACFSPECKMYSPAANSSCINTCIAKEVAPCVTPSPSPRAWTTSMTGGVSAACVTAATIVCTAKCNKEICNENSGGGNCACK